MFPSKKRAAAEAAANAEQARLVADAARAAREANLRMRIAATRRQDQERFDAQGLPRYAYSVR